MTARTPPSPSRVRRATSLIVLAYALPLAVSLAGGMVGTHDPRTLALVAGFFIVGTSGPLARRFRARWRQHRRGPRAPIGGDVRNAILASSPSLSSLTISVRGPGDELSVDGRHLLMGMRWVAAIRVGAPLPAGLAFALAHEARHMAVGTTSVLRTFRLLRAGYLAVAGAVYTGLLVNVATILDEPDRLALTCAVVAVPLIAAAHKVVLDAATSALEWWLELDADAAALEGCPAAGGETPQGILAHLATADDGALPAPLRMAALRGGRVKGVLVATLATGWIVAVTPLGMMFAFAAPGVDAADLLNAILAAFYLVAALAAASAVLASARQGPAATTRSWHVAACRVWLKMHAFMMLLLGGGTTAFTLALLARLLLGGWPGAAQAAWCLLALAPLSGASATYLLASNIRKRRAGAMIGAAAIDAARLWLTVWFLRATGHIPINDDLEALGGAIRDNPQVIWDAVGRVWDEEPVWLTCAAVACAVVAGLSAFSVRRSWAQVPVAEAAAG